MFARTDEFTLHRQHPVRREKCIQLALGFTDVFNRYDEETLFHTITQLLQPMPATATSASRRGERGTPVPLMVGGISISRKYTRSCDLEIAPTFGRSGDRRSRRDAACRRAARTRTRPQGARQVRLRAHLPAPCSR